MTNTRKYARVSGNRGQELRRVDAAEACIVCGMPDLPGVLTFAHIHTRDLHLAPDYDPTRVFCLCWHHHHGCYDQGYISRAELLQAEQVWIANKRRPQPHLRDLAFMKRVSDGEVSRYCVWLKNPGGRRAAAKLGVSAQSYQLRFFDL